MPYVLFAGYNRLAAGSLDSVAVACARAQQAGLAQVLVFEETTGRQIDLNTRGTEAEIAARYSTTGSPLPEAERHRSPGRPRLGVTAREVTLLPRHWEWLATQPGGASVTLRKLVDQARRDSATATDHRDLSEAVYRFLHAIAGNLPGYEEVIRALFAGDRDRMEALMLDWPADVRQQAVVIVQRHRGEQH